jgi:arabinofuranosyltransferase
MKARKVERKVERAVPARPIAPAIAAGVLIAVFVAVILRIAWVCDDAFITLRTVDNWVNGYGLRWNVVERVQAYTHPLWMLLLAGLYAITREPFYTTAYAAIATSLAAVLVTARTLGFRRWTAPAAIALLTVSKAFAEYSTSGLENPLSHLVLALFALFLLAEERSAPRRAFALFLLAALLAVTRMDLVLMVAPALAWFLWRHRGAKILGIALAALLPLFAWEAFSVIYYGFPLPNTAYAKLHVNAPVAVIAQQGLRYAANLFRFDPATALTICLGLVAPFAAMWRSRRWDPRLAALVAGIALYLLYLDSIGGDFMAGRFFTAPLLVAVIVLGVAFGERSPRWIPLAVVLALAALGIAMPTSPFRTDDTFGSGRTSWGDFIDEHGVADERQYYFQECGLGVIGFPHKQRPLHWEAGADAARRQPPHTAKKSNIGYFGYFAGPALDIIDPIGLGNPLLGRLPTPPLETFRPGHVLHEIPAGYLQSRLSGDARIADPKIAAYNDVLVEITRGDLFTTERWRAILGLNLGEYDALLEAD